MQAEEAKLKEKDTSNLIEEGRITLSPEEISSYQSRIKHFLNSFEFENNFSGADVARLLGYTNAHYSRLKNIGVENKISSALNFLSNIAKLKNMSLSEFIIYIENKPLINAEKQIGRGLWDWEVSTLNLFWRMESTLRRILTRGPIKEAEKNKTTFLKLELALSAVVLMLKLNTKDLLLIISIIKDFTNRKENDPIENESELDDLKNNLIRYAKDLNTADS